VTYREKIRRSFSRYNDIQLLLIGTYSMIVSVRFHSKHGLVAGVIGALLGLLISKEVLDFSKRKFERDRI